MEPASDRFILFEFDDRFACLGSSFVHYDYNDPLAIPDTITSSPFSLAIADPPFLSLECASKIAATIQHIHPAAILYCTG
jgi:hypothetical protein